MPMPRPSTRRDPLVLSASLCLLGAAIIHFAQIQAHLEEWRAAGVFFFILGVVQAVLAIALFLTLGRLLAFVSIAVSAAAIATWAVSRTWGLPFGPEAGEPEAIHRADVVATAFEAVTIAVLVPRVRQSITEESHSASASPPGLRPEFRLRSRP